MHRTIQKIKKDSFSFSSKKENLRVGAGKREGHNINVLKWLEKRH